ncbi:acid protease [Hortaea werneckii]|uniref:Peptidase A1 domain-containing protein n=1 Tax=Hortaea werneckii TaxID=91943 RepID=A0A3M7FWK6_HORWE|nr:acid protease [Hortaea werneckii]KAI6886237.1 acid protease [Hortaea werneckii]KAI6995909.1 acid protease [Hortaea werneckii]KAI7147574.1 acid protease [Hortaea werneckii]KAI7176451.1 acid protease [Hortaea werneckii]
MQPSITLVGLAFMAAGALAAPMPEKQLSKRNIFKAFSHPHHGRTPFNHRNPAAEMVKAYRKYGWEIVLMNPDSDSSWNPLDSIFGGGEESSSAAEPWYPQPTSSAAPYSYSVPASSAAWPAATSSAPFGDSSEAATSVPVGTVTSSAPASTGSASSGGNGDDITGEVAAHPEENESEYLSPVTIGGQELNLDFDTGSADLWVFSSRLSASHSEGHSVFNPDQSSTWTEDQGASWEISYGDGSSAAGDVGYDKVVIGSATVTSQAVEIATEVSGSFVTDENNDGLVGLAFSTINTVQPEPQKTWFENIMGDLEQPLFTANLEDDKSGTYTFGEIDSSEYQGEIHYTPIDKSNGFWQFDSNTYAIDGQVSQCSTCSPMIADTGTSLVLVDEDVAEAYYSQVSSAQYNSQQGGYVYDCNEDLPSFGIAIGSDYTATLNGTQITYAEIGTGTCFGGIQGNAQGGIQILGDVMLKQYLAVFDAGNEQFGVANKA